MWYFVDWIDEEQNDEWGNFTGLENKKIRCAFVRKVCYIKIFKNKNIFFEIFQLGLFYSYVPIIGYIWCYCNISFYVC
jgi:hypothetical protein